MSSSPKNFIVCKAAAGSGKTFKLVNEYLKLCLLSDSKFKFGKILAITFTNKAAAEMKERIIEHLRALSALPGEKHYHQSWLDHYKKTTGLSEELIRERAIEIRESILHNYTSLSISTIDKFTHKLIRSFARDLRLSADFEIQIESDDHLAKSTDELISLAGYDEEVTEILENYIDFLVSEGENWQIENGLNQFGKQLLNEEAGIHIEKLSQMNREEFKKVFAFLTEKIKNHEKELQELAKLVYKIINENQLSTDIFVRNETGPFRLFKKINSKGFDFSLLKMTDTDVKNFTDNNFFKPKVISSLDSDLKNKLQDCFVRLDNILQKKQPKYVFYKLLRKSIYNLSLVKQLSEKLNEINALDNTILIEDFNKIISEVVKNDPAPFIYERIGERYHHILIDEFQDTSILQFNNLLPLIENCLANQHTCLVVGDPKQAIYRWRGGDIEQFIHLPEMGNDVSREIKQSILHNYSPEELTSNYRSGKNIVHFNNEFFKLAANGLHPDYRSIYATLEQQSTKNEGYVELNLWDPKTEEMEEKILQSTFEKIQECIADGFNYSDIAIITRGKKAGARIATLLHDSKIPVISNESLLLSSSPQVNLIMNFIQYLAYPNNNVATFKMMELHQKLTSSDSHFNYEKYKFPLSRSKYDIEKYFKDHSIHYSKSKLLKNTSYQLILGCVKVFFRNEFDIYVRFLVEYIFNYWKNKPVDVRELCEWWKENSDKLSIQSTENKNAIKIMTIHASKGLQFPVVIFPFAQWKIKNGKDWIWVDIKNEDIPLKTTIVKSDSRYLADSNYGNLNKIEKSKSDLDNLNLMYVAMTRPESRLYILADNINTMAKYSTYLSSILEEKSETVWSLGTKEKYHSKPAEEQKTFAIQYKHEKEWDERLRLSVTDSSDKKEQEEIFANKKTGVFLHYLLEKFSTLEEAMQCLDEKSKWDVTIKNHRLELEKDIERVFSNPIIKELLTNKNTISECSVVDETGMTYRPDKVCLENDQVTICDFKTGLEKEEHKKQIKQYGNLFSEMNYKSIKMYLFYTKKNKLVPVQ